MSAAEQLAKKTTRKRRPRNAKTVRKVVWDCGCREIRESLQLSIHAVAAALKMSVSGYWAIEQGGDLALTTALRIATFYDRPYGELWKLK